MTDQPGPARFRAFLDTALQDYEKNAEVPLADLPGGDLHIQLERCHSIDHITTLLQDKVQAVDDFQQRDRIFKSIRAIVSILSPISAVAGVADDVGPVRPTILKACLTFLTVL
jgi:hypothetical protein